MDPSKVSRKNLAHSLSEEEIADLTSQIAKLKDEKEQMTYDYKKIIENFEMKEKFYNEDIEYWKTELDKIKDKLKYQHNKFEEEKLKLKNDQLENSSELCEQILELQSKNQKLKKELQDFQNKTVEDHTDFSRIHELEDQISTLKNQIRDSILETQVLEHKCEELQEQNMHLMNERQEYQEILDLKRSEVTKSNNMVRELSDEVFILKKQLHDIENQPRDPNAIGNSLFAEVYDSRNRIKKEYTNLVAKYKRIEEENEKLGAEVGILRRELRTMREIFNEDMKNFKPGNLFESSGDSDSMSAMRTLVASYKEEIAKLTKEEQQSEERHIRYYQGVIQQQKKEIEKLRGILDEHSFSHAMKARKFSQMGVDNAWMKARCTELESDKRFLELEVKKLENKIKGLEDDLSAKTGQKNENAQPENNKENETKKKLILQNLKVKKTPQTLEEFYGAEKVTIISPEENKAILENRPYVKKPDKEETKSERNDKKMDLSNDSKDEKENKSLEANTITSNEDKESKGKVQFTEDTKTRDGERPRPRGKNSYVLNLKTHVLTKRN